MKGNFHVQFLGEGVAATSPPYPTPGWGTTQVYPARNSPRLGLRPREIQDGNGQLATRLPFHGQEPGQLRRVEAASD